MPPQAIPPHPLTPLSLAETELARDVVIAEHPSSMIHFRLINLQEPPKAELVPFLELEHAGKLTSSTIHPARLALVQYALVEVDNAVSGGGKVVDVEALVDVNKREVTARETIRSEFLASLCTWEFDIFLQVCLASPIFQERIKQFTLPSGFEIVIEPWPYGGIDKNDPQGRRFFQGLVFAIDKSSKNPDSNFYAFPLPIIPVMDYAARRIIRIDELSTGGGGDPLFVTQPATGQVLGHCKPAEYVPELLPGGTRKDLKPLSVIQPEGPSFSVAEDNSLVEWQKWRFRVSFNCREGAVIHDITYDGRSVLYRLAMSEMTVPYADPRAPFHRKQAFDFGDGGIGHATNNLALGCDCLGVIKYFDGIVVNAAGTPTVSPNVICLHEQDNGIGWKHTNWRTGRAVVTRRRELVVQFIITLANYEYVFNYKFDQAGAITVEVRATGIVSVVGIDPGKTAPWGNVVFPGALAQNHQHIFCVRVDPAIDGQANTVVQTESLPIQVDSRTNPNGNLYEVRETPITSSSGFMAKPENARIFKIQNLEKKNPISGKPVGYKIAPPATQLLLADPDSIQARRAKFAQKHFWVTRYKDDELYAAGRYPLSSVEEHGGVTDAAARKDDVLQTDLVVWVCLGLTHNPRIEDWPVMPVEILSFHISPVDFFTGNPAIDVPPSRDTASQLANGVDSSTTIGDNKCCSSESGIPIRYEL